MAYLPFAISSLTLLFLISLFPSSIVSQNSNSSMPTVAQCAPRLLPLTTCAPFVQGTAPSPGPSCCDNLNLVYRQQPRCLCLLLSGTTLTSFPINTTLALELPTLCTLPADASACSRAQVQPSSQATNSTVAASPMVHAPPPRSASADLKSKTGSYLTVNFIMAGFLIPGALF